LVLLVLLGAVSGCKPRTESAALAEAGIATSVATRPSLPAEPPPLTPDKASEVPSLEAALDKDAAYQAVWAGPRPELNAFLSYVSALFATGGGAPAPLAALLKTKKLHDAGIKLFLIFARTGKFSDEFAKKFGAHLATTKAEPHLGVWSAYAKNGPIHDYSCLAAWSNAEDAVFLREHISAKKDGAGPFGWASWSGKGSPARPWLVDEGAALDRLALFGPLAAEERARRQALHADATKQASAKAELADAVQVTAGALFAAYQGNEVAADERYKGKKLLLTGTVASIEKGLLDGINLTLSTSNQFMPVNASLEDEEKAKVAKLSKGDPVKLMCKGQGMALSLVYVGDCTLR